MPVSYNGFSVSSSLDPIGSSRAIAGTSIHLSVRYGTPGNILEYIAEQFNLRVEPLMGGAADDGGWNYRYVAESSSWSNHASATAIDLNWNKHPRGVRGTFTPSQVAVIRQILAECHGAAYWGGDYRSPSIVDEMHFEINTNQLGCDHAWEYMLEDAKPKQKGRINMSSGIIPDRFAYDEQGNLIDETAVITLVGEWSQVSASVPSLGAASGTVGCHWGEPLLDADRELLIKVEYAYRDSAGKDQFIPKIVALKHFHQFDWTALPPGAFAFSAGFVKSARNDLNLPVSVSLTYGSK